ncbi:hypothetical protein IGI04_030168 [Brassica rapa subsp. trilocularis]|uniref:Uncharacterized protein n=1 Tax=Brassica rapa subsp. trilocularis TaxID=1813537 RepID=A0ABQ7LQ01_BRACM|nr:hypothetical protein IGI04_030168 [Brassica rapa subsp. trilocularis]
MRVKGISQLRLNQDTMEIRVKELGECLGSWTSVGLSSISSVQLLEVKSVGESGTVTGRADGPGAGRFDQMGLRLGIGSGQAPRVKKRGETAKERLWDGYGTVLGRRDGILVTARPGGWGQIQRKTQRVGRIPNPRPMVASSVSWEHTQLVRREGGRLDSTLKGMNSLEDGCSIETGFMELGTAGGQLNPVNGAFWFGSVWASPGRLLGEPMVRVQDGFDQMGLRLGIRERASFQSEEKGRNRQGAVMGRLWDGFGKKGWDLASSVSWEHTQLVRREGGRLDSTLKGMNSLEDGCSIETGFMEVQRSSDGTFVMRQEVNTTGFEDESFVNGGDLSCPRSWIGSSGRTAVQGNAPVRSHDLGTSVSWS